MSNFRLIARLDIKGKNLVKTINLEGLRVLGEPNRFAQEYYYDGIDEILFIDVVASLYGRNHLAEIISQATKHIFVPLTVGGGIRTVADAQSVLRAGADKVALNSAAVENPKLISEIADEFGNQCVVSSIEAKKNIRSDGWEIFTHSGREHTGIDAVEWARNCQDLGAGEILLTSIDQEGTRRGFDLTLLQAISANVDIPVIASGGMGKLQDAFKASQVKGVSGIAMSGVLHYKNASVNEIREHLVSQGVSVRTF
jgi:cyclase